MPGPGRVIRWKPPASRHVYRVPGGFREYRAGYRGHLWVIVPADRARVLFPWLSPFGVPDASLGGVFPERPPRFHVARLDYRGRLDRVVASAFTRERAAEECAADASQVAADEFAEFERTGQRPEWAEARGTVLSGAVIGSEPVLPWARFSWPLRRATDRAVRTRRAMVPAELLRPCHSAKAEATRVMR